MEYFLAINVFITLCSLAGYLYILKFGTGAHVLFGIDFILCLMWHFLKLKIVIPVLWLIYITLYFFFKTVA